MKEFNQSFLYEFAPEEFSGQIREALGNVYDIFSKKNLVKVNPNTDLAYLDYAGFATSGNTLVTIFPKYLRKAINSLPDEQKKIKYQNESRKLFKLLKRNEIGFRNQSLTIESADFLNENSNGLTNELAIAEFILTDYQDNGIWSFNLKRKFLNAGGETDWDLTINQSDAVVSGGNAYYFDIFSSGDETITDSLITQIHKYAVSYCIQRYSFLLDLEITDQLENVQDLEDLADNATLIYALEKQLRVTFRERDILLLKSLIELIETGSANGDDGISLYGRRDFEQVWEAALQFSFGHNQDLRKSLIPLPEWFEQSSGSYLPVNINDTLKPDIMLDLTWQNRQLMLILDAKYYLPDYTAKSTLPGVSDIVKQYFYEAVVTRRSSGYTSRDIVNGFIFPLSGSTSDNWYLVSGHTKLENDLFNILDGGKSITKPIICYTMDPDRIFSRYITYNPLSHEELEDFIKASFNYLESYSTSSALIN